MKKKVLIVDDQANVRQILEYNIKRLGHDSLTASDGLTALALLIKEKPELLLLDIMLPNADGFVVLERMKQIPDLPTKTLVISAKGTQEDVARALALGAKDYVVKPYNLEQVLQKIERMLDASLSVAAPSAAPPVTASLPPIPSVAIHRIASLKGFEQEIGSALLRAGQAGIGRVLLDVSGVSANDILEFAKVVKWGQDAKVKVHLLLPEEETRRRLAEASLAKHFVVHETAEAALLALAGKIQ